MALLTLSLSCAAQKTAWDSTFRPANYAQRVENFRSYPNAPTDVVFLGNSITDYTDWNELLQRKEARNRGISGDITFGVLERLDEVTEGKPARVFVLIGINDISRNIPDAVIVSNYEKIIRRIKTASPETKIYFNTLLPVNNTFAARNHFNKDEHIRFVNEALKKVCAAENVTLIDIHPHFLDADKRLDKRYTYDGLHLNAEGYKRWAQLLKPYLKDLALPAFNKEGHRGIRGLMPENTIPSMYAAIDHNVNTLEVDVVISKDKKVVISHDVYFHADISTTPAGKTLTAREAQELLLYNMNYDSIRKYDVGLKPHKDFPQQRKIAAYKPLLAELVDSADRYAASKGRKVIYNIELKTNAAYDGSKQPPVAETVELVMQVVKEKKLEDRCYLQSFDFRPLRILHEKYPNITTAVLIGGGEKRTLDQQLADLGYVPEMYSPHYSLVTPALVEECHRRGMKIIPWTVNTQEDMKKMMQLGVDGIITDYANYFSDL